MIRRVFPALFALLCLLAALPAHAQHVTVLLDWFVNPDHGSLFVALEKGYFKEAGLDVELAAPADPNDPPKLVAAGRADLAVTYQPQLTIQAAEGLPLARIATLVATPLNTLIVLKDGPIKTIADLKGKRIGFSVSGFEDALLSTLLGRYGLNTSDIQLINVNFSLTPALLAGQVEAVIGGYRNFELNQMDLEGKPGRAFYIEEEGVPPYDELVIAANSKRLAEPQWRRFVDALEKGTVFLINRPDEAWGLFIKGRKELDNELNRRAWRDTLPRFAHRPAALDRTRYKRFGEFLVSTGVIKTAPPIESYAIELP